MEEIIYIIIGVFWIIFAIYNSQRKLKKKQERARQQSETGKKQYDSIQPEEKPRSDFDRFFEEISEKTISRDEPEVESAPVEKKPAQKEKAVPYFSSEEYFKSKKDITESKSDLSQEYYKSRKQKKEDYSKTKKTEVTKDHEPVYAEKDTDQEEEQTIDFDLRQAIIYSEILNRPYQY